MLSGYTSKLFRIQSMLRSMTTHTEKRRPLCIILSPSSRTEDRRPSNHPLCPRPKPWGANAELAHHDETTMKNITN